MGKGVKSRAVLSTLLTRLDPCNKLPAALWKSFVVQKVVCLYQEKPRMNEYFNNVDDQGNNLS